MLIAKELALKVLGALAVGGTVIGGGVVVSGYMKKEDPEIKKLKEETGLDCKNDYCTLSVGKNLTVKHVDGSTTVTGVLKALPESAQGVGKIRVHRLGGGGEKKFSFSIEGGDITPTWATDAENGDTGGSSISKLEEFETYEIEEVTENQQKKYNFKRKTKTADEIKKLLGLADSGCEFPADGSSSDGTCQLDLNKLKAIKFEGKTEGKEPTLAEGTTKLTISWISDMEKETNTTNYPFRYRFEFSGDKEVKIPSSSEEIVKKANESVEFRVKVAPVSGGPRTITLEKVWDVERLAGKLGFTECKKEAKTCKFPEKINVYKSGTESVKEAKVTNHSEQTISFEENASDFEGKVKFILKSQVTISGGTQKSDSSPVNSIEATNYEIKEQTASDSTKSWYLSKKEG